MSLLAKLLGPGRRAAAGSASDWWPSRGRVRTQAGVQVDEDLALTYAACWCATRIIAETAASLPLLLYKRNRDDGREHATAHPVYNLLKLAPNPSMGSMAFREGRTMHQVNWGNAFAEIEREGGRPDGDVVALWPIHPSRVRPVRPSDRDNRGRPLTGFSYVVRNNDNSEVALRSEEVLHVPGVLSEDGVWGKGVVAHARESIGFGISTERHGATQFGGGNLPRVVIHGPGLKDSQARKNFREEWKEIHGHPDSAEVAILPVESKLEKLNFSNEDNQFLGTRVHNRREIATWYRVPPHMLGDLERAGYGSVEQLGLEFVIYSLFPWLRRWEEQISLKLLRPEERNTYFAEHLLASLLRGDLQARMNAYRVAIGIGVLTINECRRFENLNSIGPAGDANYVPLNMTTAERMMLGLDAGKSAAGPGSDQSGVEEDGMTSGAPPASGPGAQALGAARSVLADALRRMGTKEANAARRRAADADFPAWLDSFHQEHRRTLTEALAPAAELLTALGRPSTPAEMAARVLGSSRAGLLSAYETNTREQFGRLLDGWAGRASALADDILAGGPDDV